MTYYVGAQIQIRAQALDPDGNPVPNLASPRFLVLENGTLATMGATNAGAGLYTCLYTPQASGKHYVRFEGGSPVTSASQMSFDVEPKMPGG